MGNIEIIKHEIILWIVNNQTNILAVSIAIFSILIVFWAWLHTLYHRLLDKEEKYLRYRIEELETKVERLERRKRKW